MLAPCIHSGKLSMLICFYIVNTKEFASAAIQNITCITYCCMIHASSWCAYAAEKRPKHQNYSQRRQYYINLSVVWIKVLVLW